MATAMATAMEAAAVESDLEQKLVDVGNKLSYPPLDVEDLLFLLNLAENMLSKVKQRPSDSTWGALLPVMKSLVAKDLMNHSEIDVKVALASCFKEITRISAPTYPYCETIMKTIFRITVDALRDIGDLSSRSHDKRVSILETIIGVQSFFMLLDLECEELILEMFHHFLKTARQFNDGRVFTLMETMMTKLLNESEGVLLSWLLSCVVKEVKDGLPIPSRLAEKVIGNCAEKLRPYLIKLVKSSGVSCKNYGNIIADICQEHSDISKLNKQSTSGECLETGRVEKEVDCPAIKRKSSRKLMKRKFFDEETSEIKKQKRNTKKNDQSAKNILKETGRVEKEVDCPAIKRKSSRKLMKRKFFDEETSEIKKQKRNTKKNDQAAKNILKKCGETSTSKEAGKPTNLESTANKKIITDTAELIIEDHLAGEQSSKGFQAENHRMEFNGAMVGKRIKVWCPIDEKFYKGVVASFDPVSEKHTVWYDDGDKEKILLKDELWIDLEEATQSDIV